MFGKLIMLLLVALAIGMTVPSTRAILEEKAKPAIDNLKGRLVPRRLEVMADQLEVQVNRGQGFPSDFESWLERSYSGIPEDPWGNYYYLEIIRRGGFTVGSLGPDGQPNTADDFEVRREMRRRR